MPDPFWEWVVETLMPQCTIAELETFLDAVEAEPLSEDEIARMVQNIIDKDAS